MSGRLRILVRALAALALLLVLLPRATPAHAAAFQVTTAADALVPPAGSLREAITNANGSAGPHTISFNIAPGGLQTISLVAPLPAITQPVTIDALTQGGPGYAGPPLIVLNGAGAGAGANGFTVSANNTTIRGFVIQNFANDGIQVTSGVTGTTIQTNYIGTNAAGDTAAPNGTAGVRLDGATNSTIGGTAAGVRNVLSGNGQFGVYMLNGASGNQVQGNYIGLNAPGTAAIFNGIDGVLLEAGASNNVIGGQGTARNVISGNSNDGVRIANSGSTGNRVEGNYIGLNAAGTAGISNNNEGVVVEGRPTRPSAARWAPRATSSRATTPMACTSSTAAPRTWYSRAT